MSDVSEHDSDSDTEAVQKTLDSDTEPVQKNPESSSGKVVGDIVGHATSSNIVDELNQQVVGAQDARPEWEKYMQQNNETGAYTYTDPTDGTVYEWDATKRGWIPKAFIQKLRPKDLIECVVESRRFYFITMLHNYDMLVALSGPDIYLKIVNDPTYSIMAAPLHGLFFKLFLTVEKIDDDFIALYQANYGFTATGVHDPNVNVTPPETEQKILDEKEKKQKQEEGKGTKRKQEESTWFDIDQKTNNNIYVSGLPLTTTEEEFVTLMSKYGIIMSDDQGKLKVRMYKTPDGAFKGDARCCYLKHESVVLTCDLLDETDYNGSKIKVEQAVFELKGKYNPALKPKKKKNKKKKGKGQETLLDWVDRPAKRSKFDRIVILKNMFNHKDFEKDPTLINDLKADLRSECEKFGEIKKVMVFDRNPEGVASILFHEPEFADKCIEALNGRFYAARTISAETYDGTTNYQIQESEEELQKRLDDWEKFIELDDDEETETNNTVTENEAKLATETT